VYTQLKGSLKEAIQYHKGKKSLLTNELVIPDPPKRLKANDIVKLRTSLKVSQSIFSEILNVSVKTVQAWEAGRRQPAQSALRLLEIVKNHPEYLFQKTA
jgi:putative transcriptional regulator